MSSILPGSPPRFHPPGARPRCPARNFAALFAAVFLLVRSLAADPLPPPWDPIAPEDLAATVSSTAPGAGSEVLFSRESLTEKSTEGHSVHSVRVKLYSQSGIDRINPRQIFHPDRTYIRDLAARVVKPDGSSIELKPEDFHESIAVKNSVLGDTKVVSFAFPDLAPGDIVEYRWRETGISWIRFWRFCQADAPTREYRFEMNGSNGAVISWLNCPNVEASGAHSRHATVTIRNLPPFVAEPFMPPEFDVRGWIRLTYIYKGDTEASEWARAGEREAETFRSRTDPNLVIRHAVAGLTASARDDDDKLRRLYEFCQTSIANYTWDNSPAMAPRKAKLEDGGLQNARHTFDARIGSSVDIDYLFAALARAAGFDVRLALNAPRHALLNVHIQDGWDYMENPTIAVRRGDRWQFFDPGDPFVPFGMNSRENEGAEALLTDAKASTFVAIPASPAEATDRRRKGRFRLDEHGDLEGDVSETLTGHRAEIEREQSLDKPTADLEKTLREAVAKRLPTAELSAVAWENLRARNLPVELHYHVRVPGYAQIAGSRLLWVVNYFEAGSSPAFTSDERHYPILFPFPWSEHDDIEVALPDGYELDQPSAPASIGRDRDAIHATFDLGYVRERHAVSCQSSFVLGADGGVAYPVETYPAMKRVFDALHRSQTHTLVVKPKSVPAKAATAP